MVGPGCSGMEIAHDIADGRGGEGLAGGANAADDPVCAKDPAACRASGSARRCCTSRPGFGERARPRSEVAETSAISATMAFPSPRRGSSTRFRRDGTVPAIVDKEVIEAVKDGTVEVVGAVESLDSAGVILAGGSRVEPDAIICATGYRRALEPLVGHLGVLDTRGWPAVAAPKRRGSRPALRWLHKPPGCARLHVHAGEAVRQGDRPRGEVPPLRGCRDPAGRLGLIRGISRRMIRTAWVRSGRLARDVRGHRSSRLGRCRPRRTSRSPG